MFAGCLDADGEGAAALKRHGSGRLVVLQMDVTNQEQLAKAAQEVKKVLQEGGMNVLDVRRCVLYRDNVSRYTQQNN